MRRLVGGEAYETVRDDGEVDGLGESTGQGEERIEEMLLRGLEAGWAFSSRKVRAESPGMDDGGGGAAFGPQLGEAAARVLSRRDRHHLAVRAQPVGETGGGTGGMRQDEPARLLGRGDGGRQRRLPGGEIEPVGQVGAPAGGGG